MNRNRIIFSLVMFMDVNKLNHLKLQRNFVKWFLCILQNYV